MKNKLLFSLSGLIAAGALYFYLSHSGVQEDTFFGGQPSAVSSQNEVQGGPAKAVAMATAFERLSNIFHNSVSAYDASLSTVVYVADQNKKDGGFDSPSIDISINGTLHAGIFDYQKRPLAIAKLDNVVISTSKNENVTFEMEKTKSIEHALAQPFAFEYNEQGSVVNIHLPPNEDQFSAGIKRAIAGRLHFVLDGQQTFISKTEDNEGGKYIAEYSTKDFMTYYKKISKFIEFSSGKNHSNDPGTFSYTGSYMLDKNSRLDFLTATSTHISDNKFFAMKADSEILLNWKSSSHYTLNIGMINGFAVSSLHHKTQNNHQQQQIAAEDQISVNAFMQQIESMDHNADYNEIWKKRELLVQSIAADPNNLEGLKKLFESNLTDNQQSFLLGALKDAGSPEAQAALVEIIENEKLDIRTRQHALSHITFLEQPSEATLDYLTQAIQRTGGNPEMKATAVLALGGAIKAGLNPMDSFEPSYENKFHSALTYLEQGLAGAGDAYERNTYLMAIGNAAQESSVPTLMQLTNSSDASLRALSVDSLRFHKGEAIDGRVISMMTSDEDVSVQINATRSTVYREDNPQLDMALMRNAKSAISEDVRIASLGSLDFRNSDVPEVTAEIQMISKNDSSQKVREFAEQLYKSRIESSSQVVAAADHSESGVAGEASAPQEQIILDLGNNEGTNPTAQIPTVQ